MRNGNYRQIQNLGAIFGPVNDYCRVRGTPSASSETRFQARQARLLAARRRLPIVARQFVQESDRIMRVIEDVAEMREAAAGIGREKRSIGLVPTMGALHDGHWSLVRDARRDADCVVVSILVNPLQFGPGEDLEQYPRSTEADLAGCRQRGVDLVFAPDARKMYQDDHATSVQVKGLSDSLCGQARPGHFDGVCTVVCKLFNIVAPHRAYFGEKDYQQLVIIRRMTSDLDLPVEVVACPTVREADGLAMSSRNAYLSDDQRQSAASLYQALTEAAAAIGGGRCVASELVHSARRRIEESGASSIDYVTIVDPVTLRPVEQVQGQVRICLAAYFGATRLIDNLAVDVGGTGS